MMITKKHLSRRMVLHGAGATLALPFLDAMVPALVAQRNTAAKPVRRFAAVYAAMGMCMSQWTPPDEGNLVLQPIMRSLEPFRDRVLVVTGLDHKPADLLDAGAHPRCQAVWLTGVAARPSEGANVGVGISMDQIVATQLGEDTQLKSLELAIEDVDFVGTCGFGYSCVYTNTIAWRTPTTPLPMENNPRAVFERLFGANDSTDASVRLATIRGQRSILDSVTNKIASFEKGLGPSDRRRVSEYVESVRDVETRIQKAESQLGQELPLVEKPIGAPASFEDHAKLMFDMLALAYQTDMTRVGTYLMCREGSVRSYPEIGIAEAHHPLSHHSHQQDKLVMQAKLNAFHMRAFASFVEKLALLPDGDGTLLDHTMLLYGSGMSDSHNHVPLNLPTMVVAGKDTGVKGGRHLRFPKGTPQADLYVSLIDRLGVPIERMGDSTGNRLAGI